MNACEVITTEVALASPNERPREAAQKAGRKTRRRAWFAVWSPSLAWGVLVAAFVGGFGGAFMVITEAVVLIAAVFAAVHHAEVVARRVGEPFGTLVLALAVTVIEVALIVSVMLGGAAGSETLARDTVFAAVMIILNGLVGLSLLIGGLLHREQEFQAKGAGAALVVLTALVTLSLVMPDFTTPSLGKLVLLGLVSLILYCLFVFVLTVRHRDDFLSRTDIALTMDEEAHAPAPSRGVALSSLGLLLVSLLAVVGLAKALTPAMKAGVAAVGAPDALVGIVIAAVVLMPEGLAALRAARLNRLQTSMNLALGSALASIGLTVPAVAVVSVVLGAPLTLGLEAKEQVLLALTLLVSFMTLGAGRTTVLQGAVHLAILAAFLVLAAMP